MSRLHTAAWVLGGAGAALVFLSLVTYDVRRDPVLAGLVAMLGLLFLSQGWRIGRLDRRLRKRRADGRRGAD